MHGVEVREFQVHEHGPGRRVGIIVAPRVVDRVGDHHDRLGSERGPNVAVTTRLVPVRRVSTVAVQREHQRPRHLWVVVLGQPQDVAAVVAVERERVLALEQRGRGATPRAADEVRARAAASRARRRGLVDTRRGRRGGGAPRRARTVGGGRARIRGPRVGNGGAGGTRASVGVGSRARCPVTSDDPQHHQTQRPLHRWQSTQNPARPGCCVRGLRYASGSSESAEPLDTCDSS